MKLQSISSVALVIGLGLAVQIAPARADTVNHCIDSCFDTWSADQQELRQECVNKCSSAPNFGAIAYAVHNGAYGFSYDYHSAAQAEQRAFSDCAAQGTGCKIVISFSETCAALAAGDNERFAASLGDGAGVARSAALSACSRNGGKNCEIKAWTCARD